MENLIELNDKKYLLEENFRDAFDYEIVKTKNTEYFEPYDYIVGDWAYGKLRLKGFYDNNNSLCNKTNNIRDLDIYLKNNCAYGCKWFKLKKIIEK